MSNTTPSAPSRNRSTRIASLVALLLCALLLAGCASQTPSAAPGGASPTTEAASGGTAYPLTITDAAKKAVTINAAPQRIALGTSYPYPLIAEMLQALGVSDRVVGATDGTIKGGWPTFVTDLKSVGDNPVNVEAIAEMTPDVVLATYMDAESRTKLQGLGIPVIQVEGTDNNLLPDEYRQLGKVLNVSNTAEELASYLEAKRTEVTDVSATIPAPDKPRVYLETTRPANNASTFKTYTRGHSSNAIIEEAGGVNIAADMVGGRSNDVDVNAEWILDQNPQVVLIFNTDGFGFTPDEAKVREVYQKFVSRPGFSEIDAVKNGRVYMLPSSIVLGTQFPAGLHYIAGWLHPKSFEATEGDSIHQEILSKYCGTPLTGVWTYVPAK